MRVGETDLKWAELKRKPKRQIKELQTGHVDLFTRQQHHPQCAVHEASARHLDFAGK